MKKAYIKKVTLTSDKWSYRNTAYPWYVFVRKGCINTGKSPQIRFVAAARYVILNEQGLEEQVELFHALLPNISDYDAYI